MIEYERELRQKERFPMSKGYFDDLSIIAISDKSFHSSALSPIPCLPNNYSLEMIVEGKAVLHYNDKKIILEAPVVFWIGDCGSFQFFCAPDSKYYRHMWIDFTGDRGLRIYEALKEKFPNYSCPLTPEQAAPVQNIFQELYAGFSREGGYDHNQLVAKIEMLMSLLLAPDETNVTEGDSFLIYDSYQYFIQHPGAKHNLKNIAAERGISEVYFRKLFKERFGIPIGKFLLKLRMEYAADLLYSNRYRINEVADLCGFADAPTFTHSFIKYFGVSPSAYRREKKTVTYGTRSR